MKKLTFNAVVWKESKFYVAQCLNVDVSSFGRTRKEAMENIREAVELYFDGKKSKLVPKVTSPSVIQSFFTYA